MGRTLRILGPMAWRNLWRNPRRTWVTLIVVAVGIYSILAFASFLEAWAVSTRDRALTLLTGSGQIHAQGYLEDPAIARRFDPPAGALAAALADPAIKGWAPRLATDVVVQSEYKTLPLQAIGVDPAAERAISDIPLNIVEGRYLEGPDDPSIILGRKLAERLQTRPGKRVILLAQGADGHLSERSFTIAGLFGRNLELEEQVGFVGLHAMQDFMRTGPALTEIAFLMQDDSQLDRVVADLRAAAPDLDIRPWKELSPLAAMIEDTMDISVFIWLWVMFVLMAIGIVNTQLMAVFERTREFGLLQALGMRPRGILLLVLLESAILVGIGAVIGIILAIVTILALHDGIDISAFAEGTAMFGVGNLIRPRLDLVQMAQLSALVWALGVLVALWPARRAAKSSPVEAMSHVT